MLEFLPDLGDYWLTRWIFLRGLAGIYLCAFLVAALQWRALCGEDGILPAPRLLERTGFGDAPGLFQLHYSDRFATGAAWAGVALAVAALVGLPQALGTPGVAVAFGAMWVLQLSFTNAGRRFWGYGWESLLAETGFLAIFLGGTDVAPPDAVVWLLRWVLFRTLVGAALIKLRGDECWRRLTCLDYHYETQPLPNPLSWYFHRSPPWVNRAGVAFTHFTQLLVPFAFFVPGPVAWTAGALAAALQVSLILSGNFAWLNWLTLVLVLACFGDPVLAAVLPVDAPAETVARSAVFEVVLIGLVLLVAALSLRPVRNLFARRQLMNASFDPFRLVNTYGAFGTVTRERFEVVVEGTEDDPGDPAAQWHEYGFRGKPGALDRRPPWVAPYHLRLDWQMWFAAMGPPARHPWFLRLVEKLLEAEPTVLGLLRHDPFDGRRPRRVRARRYLYEFTDPAERRETGRWWKRRLVGEYLPPVGRGEFRHH